MSWKKMKLKYLAHMQSGDSITSDSIEAEGTYPVYGGGALRGYTEIYTHDGEHILIGRQGAHCGSVREVKGKFFASEHAVVVTHSKDVDNGWLYYLLESMNLNQYSISAAQPGLAVGSIKNLEVNVPYYELQVKIRKYIDKKTKMFESVIKQKEKLINLLENQRQSFITEAVTKGLNPNVKMKDSGVEWVGEIPENWKIKKIKYITQIKRGASPRPIDDPKYFDDDGEYAWVRIADVSSSGMYLEKTTQKMSELGASLSVKREPGDIFVSIAGTVGKPCITNIKCCIHDGFVYFPDYKYNKKFLYYIFAGGQSYKGLGKMGTQLNLNTDTIGDIKIPWPTLKEQEEIISKLEVDIKENDRLINIVRLQIEKLKEYRQALIYEAVTGKIDVREMELD